MFLLASARCRSGLCGVRPPSVFFFSRLARTRRVCSPQTHSANGAAARMFRVSWTHGHARSACFFCVRCVAARVVYCVLKLIFTLSPFVWTKKKIRDGVPLVFQKCRCAWNSSWRFHSFCKTKNDTSRCASCCRDRKKTDRGDGPLWKCHSRTRIVPCSRGSRAPHGPLPGKHGDTNVHRGCIGHRGSNTLADHRKNECRKLCVFSEEPASSPKVLFSVYFVGSKTTCRLFSDNPMFQIENRHLQVIEHPKAAA